MGMEELEDEDQKYLDNSNNQRRKLLEHMSDKMISANRKWKEFKFGSESWGTSCGDSDVDMGISLNFRNKRFDKTYILKTLSQIISENDKNGWLRVQPLLNAKYPIIRIYHIKFNYIKIDISIADRFCLKRNKLICDLINYYENKLNLPIKKLIIFIKYWSKKRGINNSYKCYLNSFGFTLLIIKFIQYLVNKNKHIIYYNKSLSNLVFEFFQFYVHKLDITKYAVSINDDSIFNKKQSNHNILEIIDPVNAENNIAQNVGYYQYDHISSEFNRSIDILTGFMMEKQSEISLFNVLTQIPNISNNNDIDLKSNLSSDNDTNVSSNDDDESQKSVSNDGTSTKTVN